MGTRGRSRAHPGGGSQCVFSCCSGPEGAPLPHRGAIAGGLGEERAELQEHPHSSGRLCSSAACGGLAQKPWHGSWFCLHCSKAFLLCSNRLPAPALLLPNLPAPQGCDCCRRHGQLGGMQDAVLPRRSSSWCLRVGAELAQGAAWPLLKEKNLGSQRGAWRHPQKFISPTIRIMKPQKQSLNIYKVIQRPTEIKGTKEGEMEGWPPPELCSGGERKTGRKGTEPTFVAEGRRAGREMGHGEGCTALVCHLPALGTQQWVCLHSHGFMSHQQRAKAGNVSPAPCPHPSLQAAFCPFPSMGKGGSVRSVRAGAALWDLCFISAQQSAGLCCCCRRKVSVQNSDLVQKHWEWHWTLSRIPERGSQPPPAAPQLWQCSYSLSLTQGDAAL